MDHKRGRVEYVTVHTHSTITSLCLCSLSPSSTPPPPPSFQHLSRWAAVLPLSLSAYPFLSPSLGGEQSFDTCTGPAVYIPSHRLRGSLPIVSIVLRWKWVKKDSSSGQKGRRAEKDGGQWTRDTGKSWKREKKWLDQDGGKEVSDYMNTRQGDD